MRRLMGAVSILGFQRVLPSLLSASSSLRWVSCTPAGGQTPVRPCCSTTPFTPTASSSSSSLLGGDSGKTKEICATIRAVLRRKGPLPLPELSKCLDDDTMEYVSAYKGGLAGFATADGGGGVGPSSLFVLVSLPGRINVLFVAEYFVMLRPADRPLATWLAALFVAQEHFPKSRFLPSLQPTTAELFQLVSRQAPASATTGRRLPSSLAELEVWVPTLEPVFVMVGKRVVLGGRASKQESQEQVERSLGARRGRGVDRKSLPPHRPWPVRPAAVALAASPQNDTKKLMAILSAKVPSSFFVPLGAIVDDSFTREFPVLQDGSVEALRSLLVDRLPSGFVDIHSFAADEAGSPLDSVYIRLLDQPPLSGPLEDLPDAVLAEKFAVFSLGERVVGELTRARVTDANAAKAQAAGIHVSQLGTVLGETTYKDLLSFFRVTGGGGGGGDGGPGGPSPDCVILLFDRLRHIFDVRLRDGFVRPWSVLPASEQPSSLTRETTPLPLLLRHAESALRAETLTVEELFARLPAFLRKQLLAAYSDARWWQAAPDALDTAAAKAKGTRCLRNFIVQHSLFFAMRKDPLGEERVCSPQFLAAAFDSCGDSRQNNSHWSRAAEYSETQKAEMIYHLLPPDQPVAWTHFSNTPEVRALPFPAFSLRQDFFKRQFSFFRMYEVFATAAIVVGRSDGVPPPASVLQPSSYTMETVIKYLALQCAGGTTDAVVTGGLSKEGRAFIKRFGNAVSLAEQLPQWFEVRRDGFNAGNSLITYVGPSQPSPSEEREFTRSALPLRRVRNDASCFLPEKPKEDEVDYDKWNPDWDEDA